MNRTYKLGAAGLTVISIVALLLYLYTAEVPTISCMTGLAVTETNIELTPDHYPPYHLLIGVPSASADPPKFVGTLVLTSSGGNSVTIPIDSHSSTKSNWLHSPSETGYILGWTQQPRLNEVLQQGETYRLRISFEGAPPPESSLWFSSMKHTTIFGDKKPNRVGGRF